MVGVNPRVLHLNTERGWRGGERQSFLLMKGLLEKNIPCWALARQGQEWEKRCQNEGIPVFSLTPLGEWDIFSALRIRRFIFKNKINILHAHTAHAAGLAALATLKTAIPVIAHRRVDFHLSKNAFSKWKMNRMTKIISISEGVKKVLLEDGIPEDKIDLIPSGVDFSALQSRQKATLEEMGLSQGAIVVGQIAALADHKDQETLIKAADLVRAQNDQVKFVVLGEGSERPKLEALIRERGLEKTVFLLGYKKDPIRFLKSFDLFCLSSKLEGLGTSLLDAMACRIPVVATETGGIPELVQPGRSGYLAPPQDPPALAKTILTALSERWSNDALLSSAFNVAKNHEISQTVEKTLALYRTLN